MKAFTQASVKLAACFSLYTQSFLHSRFVHSLILESVMLPVLVQNQSTSIITDIEAMLGLVIFALNSVVWHCALDNQRSFRSTHIKSLFLSLDHSQLLSTNWHACVCADSDKPQLLSKPRQNLNSLSILGYSAHTAKASQYAPLHITHRPKRKALRGPESGTLLHSCVENA